MSRNRCARFFCDEPYAVLRHFCVMMPDFVIDREGWRIITTDLRQNVNIHHRKQSFMTVSDLSLRFSS
jgi:hypothetical protein